MTSRAHVCLATGLSVALAALAGCNSLTPWRQAGKSSPQPVGGVSPNAFTSQAPPSTAPASKKPADDFAGQLSLARLAERNGQEDYARGVYESVLKKQPRNVEAHHRLGVLAARDHQFDTAHRHFAHAAETGPPSSSVLNDWGYCLYLQDRLPEAEQKLRAAVAANPRNASAQNNLGLVLGEQGRFGESLAAFRQTGDDADAYANLAFAQAARGDLQAAEASYNRAFTLDNSMRPAADALVQIHQRRKLEAHAQRQASGMAPSQMLAAGSATSVRHHEGNPPQQNPTASAQGPSLESANAVAVAPATQADAMWRQHQRLVQTLEYDAAPRGEGAAGGQHAAAAVSYPQVESRSGGDYVSDEGAVRLARPATFQEPATDPTDAEGVSQGAAPAQAAAPRPPARGAPAPRHPFAPPAPTLPSLPVISPFEPPSWTN